MVILKKVRIRNYEMGLHFRHNEFIGLLGEGLHWLVDPLMRDHVEVVSQRDPWLVHDQLDMIVKSGALGDLVVSLDLKDHQRALVWIDGRFSRVLAPGLYAYWTGLRDVRVEVIDISTVRFAHPNLNVITQSPHVHSVLEITTVNRDCVGVLFVDGNYVETLTPGQYAFWKEVATTKLIMIDLREMLIDISGQDIMTADKVTLRLNAVVTYRITDARQAVSTSEDVHQALYREAQLAIRAEVGTRDLDVFLTDKDGVARDIEASVRQRASTLGIDLVAIGIRDVILPGDMKDLMNKVTEAKKAAEANLISRREETAAMRSQANTARLLTDNPTLMRLRELEVLEKIASTGKLTVVLGDKGLADQVVNLL